MTEKTAELASEVPGQKKLLTAEVQTENGPYYVCSYDHTQLAETVAHVKNNQPFINAGVQFNGREHKITAIDRGGLLKVRLSDLPGQYLWSEVSWV